MPRPPRIAWALCCAVLLAVGCSAVTDFDRDKLSGTVDPHRVRDAGNGHEGGGGMDSSIVTPPDADVTPGEETGVVVVDDGGNVIIVEEDAGPPIQCMTHADCPRARLCCDGTCVATNAEGRCTGCAMGCELTTSNACTDRVCGCGANGSCTDDKKFCVGNGKAAVCAECRDANDCDGRSDGRTQCIQGSCAACDPANNGGCSGTTPICNAKTFTCEACKGSPDNCPGANSVCTASGACGGCTANDAADCTSPTAPICNLAVNPSVCRGCMSDTECMTELSRPYCVGNQRCAICSPTNDTGCGATSGTPDCRLNANGVYQCQACTSTSCGTGLRCDSTSGKCVQCRNDNDCDGNSATPYCDTAMGVCRGCNTVTGIGGNAWCSLNTLLSLNQRPVCHTSGRCVRCDANNVGICTTPTARCEVVAAAPQNNNCVECRQGVAADCPAGAMCGTNGRCRGCAAATEAQDCPANSASPVCDVASQRCVACLGTRGCTGQGMNGSCLAGATSAGNRCVDCINPGMTSECSGNNPVCDTGSHNCVSCIGELGCNGNRVCLAGASPAQNRCVECINASDCKGGNACQMPTCTGNTCTYPPRPTEDGLSCTTGMCAGGVITQMTDDSACSSLTTMCTTGKCVTTGGAPQTGCTAVPKQCPNNAVCDPTLGCPIVVPPITLPASL